MQTSSKQQRPRRQQQGRNNKWPCPPIKQHPEGLVHAEGIEGCVCVAVIGCGILQLYLFCGGSATL